MRIMFGNWKYIFNNLWFVLPFALLPGVFLSLALDYSAIAEVLRNFFSGVPRVDFVEFFRTWSLIRIDSWWGALFSVGALVVIVVCLTVMLSLVEKHMRIGKRTFSGAFSQLGNFWLTAVGITLFYTVLYELWALVLAAFLFAVSELSATALVYLLEILAFFVLLLALLYVVAAFYLWLPCLQITGFRPYDAFIYSYRLMMGVRWRLISAFLISFLGGLVVLGVASLFPEFVFRAIAFVLYVFFFLSFCIRMETVYFATDKLDREDRIRSYKEL